MEQKQAYEPLRCDLIRLDITDIVRTSTNFGNGGEDGGIKLPPDFD